MSVKKADLYEHNNEDLAFVDWKSVRGMRRKVANRTELYALASKADQLEEQVTLVRVLLDDTLTPAGPSEQRLVDAANIGSAAGWVAVEGGTGASQPYDDSTLRKLLGAPQWVAGPQKEGALVFNANFVYRVKLDIANGQAPPTATNQFYLKVGDLSSITRLIPPSAAPTNLLATHDDLGWYSVGNPLAGNWTTDPYFSLSAFRFSTLDGTGNRFFGTIGGDSVITSTLLNSRFYSFSSALVIADGARELDITFCTNLTLGARCAYSEFKNCQYVQVGNDCANLEVINCYGTAGAPFLIPQGSKNKIYRNNKEVTDGTGTSGTTRDLLELSPALMNAVIALTYNNCDAVPAESPAGSYPGQQFDVIESPSLTRHYYCTRSSYDPNNPSSGIGPCWHRIVKADDVRDPYDVPAAKRRVVVDANVPALEESDSTYYGRKILNTVYGYNIPTMYECMPSAPLDSSGTTVWYWVRQAIL